MRRSCGGGWRPCRTRRSSSSTCWIATAGGARIVRFHFNRRCEMSQERKPGVLRRAAAAVGRQVQRIFREVSSTVTDRVIPQGAAEIGQALYGSPGGGTTGYTPYGTGQRPAPIYQPPQQARGFDQRLAEYASRGAQRGRQQER